MFPNSYSTLVGAGAYEWAKRNNIETTNQDELITGLGFQSYKSCIRYLLWKIAALELFVWGYRVMNIYCKKYINMYILFQILISDKKGCILLFLSSSISGEKCVMMFKLCISFNWKCAIFCENDIRTSSFSSWDFPTSFTSSYWNTN